MKRAKLHNKLVRDNIPEVLDNLGIEADVEEIKDEVRYTRLLLDKLEEEAQSAGLALDETFLEELADIETVIDAILKVKGYSREDLRLKKEEKDSVSGVFDKRLFLYQTHEQEGEKEDGDTI